METICSNCGAKNKSTNIKCENCGEILDSSFENQYEEELQKEIYEQKKEEIVKNIALKDRSVLIKVMYIIFSFPFLFTGLIFTIMGAIFWANDQISIKEYEKIEGVLVNYNDYDRFDNDGNSYSGIYEYTVNGKSYKISSNYYSNQNNFKKKITIMYNPNNPSEAVVIDRWYSSLIIIGIIILVVEISIYIIISKVLKKNKTKKSDAITYTE